MANRTKKEMTHGYSMYRYRGCRCEICKRGAFEVRNKYRKKSDNMWVRLDVTPFIEKLTENGQLFHIEKSYLDNWRAKGIDVYSADKWCLKFGWHPAEVFGHSFYINCFSMEVEND